MFVETEARPQGEVDLDEASRLLLRAADLIDKNGLWNGSAPEAGAFASQCVANAISIVGDFRRPGLAEARERFIRAIGGKNATDIWAWNDAPGRTKEEVVAKLRAVAFAV